MKSNKKKNACPPALISNVNKNTHQNNKTYPNNNKTKKYPVQKEPIAFHSKTSQTTKETVVEEVEAVSCSNKKYH